MKYSMIAAVMASAILSVHAFPLTVSRDVASSPDYSSGDWHKWVPSSGDDNDDSNKASPGRQCSVCRQRIFD